jgi:hypothetical protein
MCHPAVTSTGPTRSFPRVDRGRAFVQTLTKGNRNLLAFCDVSLSIGDNRKHTLSPIWVFGLLEDNLDRACRWVMERC